MGAGTFPNTNKHKHNWSQIVVNAEKNIVDEVKSQHIVKWPAGSAYADVKVSRFQNHFPRWFPNLSSLFDLF